MNFDIDAFPVTDPKAFAAKLVTLINAEMDGMNRENLLSWQDFRCIDWPEAVLMELHEFMAQSIHADREMETRYYSVFERQVIGKWLSRHAVDILGTRGMIENIKTRGVQPYVLMDEELT